MILASDIAMTGIPGQAGDGEGEVGVEGTHGATEGMGSMHRNQGPSPEPEGPVFPNTVGSDV